MEYTEKWGKDVDEAVRLALEELGLNEDQVMVTVLEESSKGFLGLGAKLAKVRVEKISDEKEKKEKKSKKPEKKFEHKVRDYRKKDKNKTENNKNQQNRNENKKKEKDIVIDLEGKPSLSKKPDNLVEDNENDAGVFLGEIINKMGIDVDIKTFKNEECVYIELSGKDSKTVIGKRGQALDSLQYLTNLVSNKDKEDYIRVIIDVEGYRSRREKTLERLAVKLANKVLKSGNSVKLEPMNPYERKVIHAALQTVDGISTRSEGEEPYRRVIVEKK